MSETAHTPGPWMIAGRSAGSHVHANSGEVAWLRSRLGISDDEIEANARLIAAAPDLLEAMSGIDHFKDALDFREDHLSKALRQWIEAGSAALSKATA